MKTSYHISVSKKIVIHQIKELGAASVLVDFDGTDAEAIAAIEAEPIKFFTIGDCDNQDTEGRCLGHRKEQEGKDNENISHQV